MNIPSQEKDRIGQNHFHSEQKKEGIAVPGLWG